MVKFALLRYLSEVSIKSFVVLIIGNSKSFHLGAQGTFKVSRCRRSVVSKVSGFPEVPCLDGHECRRARVRVRVCECVRVRERGPQSRLACLAESRTRTRNGNAKRAQRPHRQHRKGAQRRPPHTHSQTLGQTLSPEASQAPHHRRGSIDGRPRVVVGDGLH